MKRETIPKATYAITMLNATYAITIPNAIAYTYTITIPNATYTKATYTTTIPYTIHYHFADNKSALSYKIHKLLCTC